MTSVYRKNNRRAFVLDVGAGGKRQRVGIGRVTAALAKQIEHHVDELLSMRGNTVPIPAATQQWLDGIDDKLYFSIHKIGLVPPRRNSDFIVVTVSRLFEDYLERRTDLQPSTRTIIKSSKLSMNKFFTPARNAGSLSAAECADFKRWLLVKLSPATAAGQIKKCKQIYRDAVDRGVVKSNPFAGIVAGSQKNRDRIQYVPSETAYKVIEEAPDARWRLLIKFARFAGLRIPSEPSVLKWSDVLWDKNRISVYSPKTKSRRLVPLFPVLLPELRELFEAAKPGDELVFGNTIGSRSNLRTGFQKIVKRAGVKSWPRLFHNLRASCQTDLSKTFPQHVACEWLGNSEKIADDHYLSVTDADFEAAIKTGDGMYAATTVSRPASQTAQTTEGEEINGMLIIQGEFDGSILPAGSAKTRGKSARKLKKRPNG